MKVNKKVIDKLFLQLPKKEQKRLNSLNRIPTCRPGVVYATAKYPAVRQKRWSEE